MTYDELTSALLRAEIERDEARATIGALEQDLEMRRSLGRIDQTRIETIAQQRNDALAIAQRAMVRLKYWVGSHFDDCPCDDCKVFVDFDALPWAQDDA